jgi:peptidoglycan/LPS O-acetylase OafA/YrhL
MIQEGRLHNNYDFLRILASLCIMFYHSFGLTNSQLREPLIILTEGKLNTSFIGLSIFFSISGFLIAKSALRSSSLKNYLWKRLLRIQPLLFFLCILTVFMLGPLYTSLSTSAYFKSINTWTYFRNVMPLFGLQFTLPGVFTHNPLEAGVNGSLWTLIVEERLYLLMSFLFLFRMKKRYFLVFILILNIVFLLNHLISHVPIPLLSSSAFFYGLIFLNSAILYIIKIDFNKWALHFLVAGIIIFFITYSFSVSTILDCYTMPLIVNSLAHIKGPLNKAGKWGDFTYGTYVFAFPIQQMLIANGFSNVPYKVFLLTFLITIPLAIVSWHFLEKKFLSMKSLVN